MGPSKHYPSYKYILEYKNFENDSFACNVLQNQRDFISFLPKTVTDTFWLYLLILNSLVLAQGQK